MFVTSETVRHPRPGAAAYVTSKWGLEGLARALQMELEGTGVRATIIQPGQTLTEMGSQWEHEEAEALLESWIHWGLARHDNFLRPEVSRSRGARRGLCPEGNASGDDRGPARGTGQRKIARDDRRWRMTTFTGDSSTELKEPHRVSGGDRRRRSLRRAPYRSDRAHDAGSAAECGDVGEFRLAGRDVVLLTGARRTRPTSARPRRSSTRRRPTRS